MFDSTLLQLGVSLTNIPSASRLRADKICTVFPSDIAETLFSKYIIDPKKNIHEEGVFSRSYQPAERAGSIEDMAGLILYMAGRAGGFLNGSVMLSDGGKLATMPCTY